MCASNRDVEESFQRSSDTISRTFHEVLKAISGRVKGHKSLAHDIIRPKDPIYKIGRAS